MSQPSASTSVPQEHLLRALLKTIPDKIYFKDLEGRFLLVNPALLDFFKLQHESDLLGHTDFDFFQQAHAEAAYADEQEVIRSGEPMEAKLEREDFPDGRVTWVSTTKIPLYDGTGQIIGTCGISRDVTEEQEKNERLKEYAQALAEKQAQLEQELQMAREIQEALLPQQYPNFPSGATLEQSVLSFAHRYLPTSFIGGDFLSVFPVSSHEAGIFISDVMGHGVPAALVTTTQRILVNDLQPYYQNPGAFLTQMNQQLCETFRRIATPLFTTALYLVIDVRTGRLTYANAGHPQPFVLHRNQSSVKMLPNSGQPKGLACGMIPDSVYHTEETRIEPGDVLLLYTDGLSDFKDEEGTRSDAEVCRELITPHAGKTGGELLEAILAQARKRAKGEPFPDDICLASVEFKALAV